jgi:hypothetical protein
MKMTGLNSRPNFQRLLGELSCKYDSPYLLSDSG